MKRLMMMVGGCLLAAGVAQAESVSCLDYDAATGSFTNAVRECTLVTGGTTEFADGAWYAVQGNVTCENAIEVRGTAHLILCDGCEFTVNGGVGVGEGKALTIYGQGANSGKLTANGSERCADIGGSAGIGGREYVHSGNCGTVTINGGIVSATGGEGAGIGASLYGSGGAITINGGRVTATGGWGYPGIGGGDQSGSSGSLTVRGGVVTAQGSKFAAGIGGGERRAGGVVTISGGEVTATGGEYGAGIGGGFEGAGGTVIMTGGALRAVPGGGATDIGTGDNNYKSLTSGTVTLLGGAFWKRPNDEWLAPGQAVSANPDPRTRSVYPYRVTAPLVRVTVPHDNFKVRWTGDPLSVTNDLTSGSFTVPPNTTVELFYEVMEGATYQSGELHRVIQVGTQDLTMENPPVASVLPLEYVDEHGLLRTNENYRILGASDRTLLSGWYAVTRTIEFSEIAVGGDVHLVLCDGQELRATDGIGVDAGKSLTVYGQSAGSGKLTAHGSRNCAGIGGRNPNNWKGYGNCGSVTINGGIVSATGGEYGAGIGSGRSGSGGTVTINGGTVKATGGYDGAGIGNGFAGAGGSVTINGGSIVANSLSATPKNAAGEVLHKVTIPFPEGTDFAQLVQLGGLGDYGTFGIYPIDNKFTLFLPDGEYHIRITVQGSTGMCVAVVNGKDVVVEYVELGFTINGVDIAESQGEGWTFTEEDVLKLTDEREYVLAGYFTNTMMSVSVEANATVVLSNATVYAEGAPALSVSGEKTVTLKMSGLVSYLGATNNMAAIRLGDGATLKVGTAAGADLLATVAVFNYDDAPAIVVGANGSVEVGGGSFLVWADRTAVEGGFKIADAPERPLIMKTGAEPETARFAESYQGEACLGIAPSFTVTVPECEGIASVAVSNDVEALPGSSGTFCGMLTDVVTVDFAAAESCEILGGGHVFIPALTNDVTVGSAECPWPDLRKWIFTVTVPEVPNVVHRLETSDAHVQRVGGQEYQIASNSEVTVTFAADTNYRFTASADRSWTLTGDVAFGATDGFPLPAAEGILGTVANPWPVGEGVTAYTNEIEQLTITGAGPMADFADAADVPWDPATVTAVTVESGVTKVGANAWTALGDGVLINGESIQNRKLIADGFALASPEIPSGYISPADPNAIAIVDGKAYLGVSIATNSDITAAIDGWGTAKLDPAAVEQAEDGKGLVIPVPATSEKGFMILRSKPAK